MKYLTICSNCKCKSSSEEEFCSSCGMPKPESNTHLGFWDTIVEEISSRITFFDRQQIYISVLLRGLIFVIGYILIPQFIFQSEIFLIVIYAYTVLGMVKEIEQKYASIRGIYTITQFLIATYAGAGIANLISYAGKQHGYKLGYFFNPHFLLYGMIKGNNLIYVGIIAAVGLTSLAIYFSDIIKESNNN